MLRHARDITRFNRERYIQKRRNLWWIRNSLWAKKGVDGYLSKFDIKQSNRLEANCYYCGTLETSYSRAKIKRETDQILKDYNIR